MDDQNQNPDPQAPQQNLPPETPKPIILENSKVLQPSESFLNEMKTAAAAAPSPTPTPTPTPTPADPGNQQYTQQTPPVSGDNLAPNQITPPVTQPSSIYPTATRGVGYSQNQNLPLNNDQPAQLTDTKKTGVITIIIIAFGALLAFVSLLDFISGVRIASRLGTVAGLSIVVGLVGLLLGVGLILRKEIARFVYIILACIALVLGLIATPSTISNYNKANSYEKREVAANELAVKKQISVFQQELAQENDGTINQQNVNYELPSVIEQEISQNQRILVIDQKVGNVSSKPYLFLIEAYALSILPIVFLTRPSVKKEFS